MSTEKERLVTLITVNYPHEISVLKGRLEAEGIPCFIKDGYTIQVNPLYSNAIGGVKLQVLEKDLIRAQEIMSLNESDYIDLSNDELQEDILMSNEDIDSKMCCPICNSKAVLPQKLPTPLYAISILLLGFPLIFMKKKYHCFTCGADFEKK